MWWSYVLAFVGLVGLFLTTRKNPKGFLIGIAAQSLWIIYAITTDQWGFIITAASYAAVNFMGYRDWTRPKNTEKEGAHDHQDGNDTGGLPGRTGRFFRKR